MTDPTPTPHVPMGSVREACSFLGWHDLPLTLAGPATHDPEPWWDRIERLKKGAYELVLWEFMAWGQALFETYPEVESFQPRWSTTTDNDGTYSSFYLHVTVLSEDWDSTDEMFDEEDVPEWAEEVDDGACLRSAYSHWNNLPACGSGWSNALNKAFGDRVTRDSLAQAQATHALPVEAWVQAQRLERSTPSTDRPRPVARPHRM